MVDDHRVLDSTVDPAVVPTDVETHALAISREKALQMTDDRAALLASCVSEVEQWTGRALWRGSAAGGERTSTAVVEVSDYSRPVALCPDYPRLAPGATISATSVKVWRSGAFAAVDYELRPSGRILVGEAGEYQIVAAVLAPEVSLPAAREGVARLFAFREVLRPGDLVIDQISVVSMAAAMLRSGASEILRTLRPEIPV